MTRRPALLAAAALAAAGLALSSVLVFEHASAHAGGVSFCAISEYVDCDRVATSPWSVALGLPVAAWGALGYGLALLLALAGLAPGRRHEGWPAGLLVLLAAAFAVAALVLAGISTLAIGALCILCTASWLVSFALLGAAVRATRPDGVRAAVRADLALVRERKGMAAALAVAGIALVLIVVAAYPRYWSRPAPRAAVPGPGADGGEMSRGPLVVVEYSDYACPACARAHVETKALLAGRTDVRLVRRHFPLDSDCNPALTRRMHPGACDLARVGICAEAQGKLEPTEDALFANQVAKRSIEEIVRAVGLDLDQLKACLASRATEERLRSDVEMGIRAGLKVTPTFVVGGRLFPGAIPPEALPARTTAASP
jgi:protein-disulfide isomerase